MSLYLDTSCLWKLLQLEPDSPAVFAIIESEPQVLVSTLVELETTLLLQSLVLGGTLRARRQAQLAGKLAEFRGQPPFVHKTAPHDLAQIALRQIGRATAYCRTLDRLHLAAMEALGADRLLTNDDAQAAAAHALGFGVVRPTRTVSP